MQAHNRTHLRLSLEGNLYFGSFIILCDAHMDLLGKVTLGVLLEYALPCLASFAKPLKSIEYCRLSASAVSRWHINKEASMFSWINLYT